ncbi:MAG TPA: T9SS type A sorting domain-containing protein [Cyclobacteriaceae bacterium]|nr:T9SS type A sorting domain-containing protein [Cyclobacteriaceae bacterium]
MIRPVFGKGDGIVTGWPLPEAHRVQFYPNPSHGSFIVEGEARIIKVYDVTGRTIGISVEKTPEGQRVQLLNARPGMYILQLFGPGGASSHRIRVD